MTLSSGLNELRKVSQAHELDFSEAPSSSLAFDWVFTGLVFLIGAGFFLDGWSHVTYGPDQSVLSEYHLLFNTSLIVTAIWLFGNAYLNRRDGYEGLMAIPAGYVLSAVGVVIFGITGMVDLIGHQLYGFEVGLEALFSPSHTGLFIGWALVSLGPARAALIRRERVLLAASNTDEALKQSWGRSVIQLLPALIAWISFINVLAFWSNNFFATANQWMMVEERLSDVFVGQLIGVMSVLLETALLFAGLIWLINRFKLPIGSITFYFVFIIAFGGILEADFSMIPFSLFAGVSIEALYHVLKPSLLQSIRLYVFSVCAAWLYWLIFYIPNIVAGDVWYTPYMWTGTVTYGGIAALLIALLSTSSLGRASNIARLEAKVAQ